MFYVFMLAVFAAAHFGVVSDGPQERGAIVFGLDLGEIGFITLALPLLARVLLIVSFELGRVFLAGSFLGNGIRCFPRTPFYLSFTYPCPILVLSLSLGCPHHYRHRIDTHKHGYRYGVRVLEFRSRKSAGLQLRCNRNMKPILLGKSSGLVAILKWNESRNEDFVVLENLNLEIRSELLERHGLANEVRQRVHVDVPNANDVAFAVKIVPGALEPWRKLAIPSPLVDFCVGESLSHSRPPMRVAASLPVAYYMASACLSAEPYC